MEKTGKVLSRRKFFELGLGAAGTFAATTSLAQVCGIATGKQALGPFFPRPGTPDDPIREDADPTTPIYLANDSDLTFVKGRSGRASGQVVLVKGRVESEACQPIKNATLIIWQASETGRYNHTGDAENQDFTHPVTRKVIRRTLDPFFQYWGRTVTSENGEYQFKTIVPGFYPADLENGWYRPPHIHFMISAMGYPQFVTQMYFKGNEIAESEFIQDLNGKDLLLQTRDITDAQRQKLVVEFKRPQIGADLEGRFDIQLTR